LRLSFWDFFQVTPCCNERAFAEEIEGSSVKVKQKAGVNEHFIHETRRLVLVNIEEKKPKAVHNLIARSCAHYFTDLIQLLQGRD
jgi:hypothetical protein